MFYLREVSSLQIYDNTILMQTQQKMLAKDSLNPLNLYVNKERIHATSNGFNSQKLSPIHLSHNLNLAQQCENLLATLKNIEPSNFQKEWKKIRVKHQYQCFSQCEYSCLCEFSDSSNSDLQPNQSRSSKDNSQFSLELKQVIQSSSIPHNQNPNLSLDHPNNANQNSKSNTNTTVNLNNNNNQAKHNKKQDKCITNQNINYNSNVNMNINLNIKSSPKLISKTIACLTPTNKSINMQEYNKLQKIAKYLILENICYNRSQFKLKNILQEIVITIQNKLSNICKDFTYYTSFQQENQEEKQTNSIKKDSKDLQVNKSKNGKLENNKNLSKDIIETEIQKQTENMCRFIKNTINKLVYTNIECQKIKQKFTQLKAGNVILLKQQEKLLNYIEERKIYSQKLKGKISELKSQIKRNGSGPKDNIQKIKIVQDEKLKEELKKANQTIQDLRQQLSVCELKNNEDFKIYQQLNLIEQNTDLKYRNRNDLILMIRALSFKVLKYEKKMSSQNIMGTQTGTVSGSTFSGIINNDDTQNVRNRSRQRKTNVYRESSSSKQGGKDLRESSADRKKILGQSIDKFLNKSAVPKKKISGTQSNS